MPLNAVSGGAPADPADELLHQYRQLRAHHLRRLTPPERILEHRPFSPKYTSFLTLPADGGPGTAGSGGAAGPRRGRRCAGSTPWRIGEERRRGVRRQSPEGAEPAAIPIQRCHADRLSPPVYVPMGHTEDEMVA